MAVAMKQQCLLPPLAACGGAASGYRHLLHPLLEVFSGKTHSPGQGPPLVASKRQVWLLSFLLRIFLRVPHRPSGMLVPGRTLGCREGAGEGLAPPSVGKGQPRGLPGRWHRSAAAFLARRSCHHSQAGAELSLCHW